jgi:hypothetical protein
MPISSDVIGRQFPGGTFSVTDDAVARFAAAVESPPCTVEHDHLAPVTFPITALMGQMEGALRDAGVDWTRVVHGDQKFTYAQPLRVGAELTGSTVIESIKSIAGNEIIGVRSEFNDASGQLVVSCWSTIVERGEK